MQQQEWINPTPGTAWVFPKQPNLEALVTESGFRLLEHPDLISKALLKNSNAMQTVGICVAESAEPDTSAARLLFERLLSKESTLVRKIVVICGRVDMPLAAFKDASSTDEHIVGAGYRDWFPAHTIEQDELQVVWQLGLDRRETFQLRRLICAINSHSASEDAFSAPLPLSSFMETSLGKRCSHHFSQRPLYGGQAQSLNENVSSIDWENCRMLLSSKKLIGKVLTVAQYL